MPTKAELIEKIEHLDRLIAEKKAELQESNRLTYDEWRAFLWTECMGCGRKMHEPQGCPVCMPIKDLVNDEQYDDYRERYRTRMKRA